MSSEERPGIAETFAVINRTVHEPARLAILTVLASCERADFLFLERATGLTRGNLSVQLTRLEEAGLIEIRKIIQRKRTLTTASLRDRGRRALDVYWAQMDALRKIAHTSPNRAKASRTSRVPVGMNPVRW
jgi:DNA-binding transcriptional ArsR family regulator